MLGDSKGEHMAYSVRIHKHKCIPKFNSHTKLNYHPHKNLRLLITMSMANASVY